MPRSFSALPARPASCQNVLPPSMMTSPACSSFDSASMVASVILPAGSITQAVRGFSSFLTKSSRALAPTAPSAAIAAPPFEATFEAHTQATAAALGQHAEIAARLRGLDHTEGGLLTGHGEILGIVCGNLQEYAAVGAALVGLTGGMQETRAEFGAGRDMALVADR